MPVSSLLKPSPLKTWNRTFAVDEIISAFQSGLVLSARIETGISHKST